MAKAQIGQPSLARTVLFEVERVLERHTLGLLRQKGETKEGPACLLVI